MDFWGFTIQIIGELLIAFTVLRVHIQLLHEKKIDRRVTHDIQLEQIVGMAGIACIVIGYLMQL